MTISEGLHKIENKESFFIGRSTTNKEALKMLRSKRIGTFLVRFSPKEQKYCINSKNEVNSFSSTINEYDSFQANQFIPIQIKSINDQELYFIRKGYSHPSILDLVTDFQIRDKYNLMFPFFSEEADKVEKDTEYYKQKLQRAEKSETNEVVEEDSEENDAESLENLSYFHGEINRDEAETRLEDEHIGTFLVRFENILKLIP